MFNYPIATLQEGCPDPCRDFGECVKCRVFETSDLTAEQCKVECANWNITEHIVDDDIESWLILHNNFVCLFIFIHLFIFAYKVFAL